MSRFNIKCGSGCPDLFAKLTDPCIWIQYDCIYLTVYASLSFSDGLSMDFVQKPLFLVTLWYFLLLYAKVERKP